LSTLHLTSYILPALCASSPLAISTVREFIGISQYFSLASVSFISMLLTRFSPVIQVTEDVYTGGNSGGGLWHYYALHHAQSLIAITKQIGGNKLPVDMKLQALIVFNVKLSTDTLRIQVFWNAMLQCWVSGSWHSRVDRQGSWTVTAWPMKMKYHDRLKCWEPVTQWQSAIFQKSWSHSSFAVRTSNLMMTNRTQTFLLDMYEINSPYYCSTFLPS